MDAPVSLGMIGAGYAAEQLHWPALRRITEVRVQAVTDLDRGRAEKLASRLPGARVVANSNALIADDRVQAVAILTPPESHGA